MVTITCASSTSPWWAWIWSKSSRKGASSQRRVCLCVCLNFENGCKPCHCWPLRFPSPHMLPHVAETQRNRHLQPVFCARMFPGLPVYVPFVGGSAGCRTQGAGLLGLLRADCRLPTADCRLRANANWHISHRVRVWGGARNRWSRAEVRRCLPFTEQKPLVEPSRALQGAWQAGGRSSSPSAR